MLTREAHSCQRHCKQQSAYVVQICSQFLFLFIATIFRCILGASPCSPSIYHSWSTVSVIHFHSRSPPASPCVPAVTDYCSLLCLRSAHLPQDPAMDMDASRVAVADVLLASREDLRLSDPHKDAVTSCPRYSVFRLSSAILHGRPPTASTSHASQPTVTKPASTGLPPRLNCTRQVSLPDDGTLLRSDPGVRELAQAHGTGG